MKPALDSESVVLPSTCLATGTTYFISPISRLLASFTSPWHDLDDGSMRKGFGQCSSMNSTCYVSWRRIRFWTWSALLEALSVVPFMPLVLRFMRNTGQHTLIPQLRADYSSRTSIIVIHSDSSELFRLGPCSLRRLTMQLVAALPPCPEVSKGKSYHISSPRRSRRQRDSLRNNQGQGLRSRQDTSRGPGMP